MNALVFLPPPEATRAEVEAAVYGLLQASSVAVDMIESLKPPSWDAHEFQLLVWGVRRRLLDEGITTAKRNGQIYRTNARQTERRGKSHASAAYRKLETAIKVATNAAAQVEDPEDRARLERAALRRANQLVDAKASIRGAGRPRAKGL